MTETNKEFCKCVQRKTKGLDHYVVHAVEDSDFVLDASFHNGIKKMAQRMNSYVKEHKQLKDFQEFCKAMPHISVSNCYVVKILHNEESIAWFYKFGDAKVFARKLNNLVNQWEMEQSYENNK